MIDTKIKDMDIRFGTLAVEKGYITAGQLGTAVSIQMREDLKDHVHRFLGEILVEQGFMDRLQVRKILSAQSRLADQIRPG